MQPSILPLQRGPDGRKHVSMTGGPSITANDVRACVASWGRAEQAGHTPRDWLIELLGKQKYSESDAMVVALILIDHGLLEWPEGVPALSSS